MTDPGNLIELNIKPRPRIIVADDEQDIATLIEDWLSDTFEVTLALNGKAALQKAAWQKPDVILCDIVMPDMGGYEVVRALQSNAQTQSVPVIVMTAKNYDDSTVTMIKAEPNVMGFIVKPFKPSALVKMIHTVLGGQRTFEGTPPITGAAPLPPAPPVAAVPSSAVAPTSPPPPVSAPSPAGVAASTAPIELTLTTTPPTSPHETPEGVLSAAEPIDAGMPPPRSYETSLALRGEDPLPARRPAPGAPGASTVPRVVTDTLNSTKKTSERVGGVKVWLKRLFLTGAVLVGLLLGGAEWMCRWTEQSLGARVFLPPIRVSRYEELPYQFEPKTHWTDGGADYHTNIWGLRNAEFDLVAPPEEVRVIVLGGNTVFGLAVSEGATLAERLESALRQKRDNVRVLNAGHWAYSPQEQWTYYEKEGFQFRPQVVLWVTEPRGAEYPSKAGLRQLAEWSGRLRGAAGRSRLVRMLALRQVRKAPATEEQSMAELFERADAFAQSKGTHLVALVPSADRPNAPSFRAWDPLPGISREEMIQSLVDRTVPLLQEELSRAETPEPVPAKTAEQEKTPPPGRSKKR